MEIAKICPVPSLEAYCAHDRYHLILAHWVEQNGEYAAWYRNHAANYNQHVILDNGAHENSTSSPLENLESAAMFIRPAEICLPDTLMDGPATYDQSVEAFHHFKAFKTIHPLYGTQLMGIPQGEDFKAWLLCLRKMLLLEVDSIGIARAQADNEGSWLPHVLAVNSMNEHIPIHLLGSPYDMTCAAEVEEAFPGRVRSTDTAKPFHYAMAKLVLEFPMNGDQRNGASRPENYLTYQMSQEEHRLAQYNWYVFQQGIKKAQYLKGYVHVVR